MAPLMSPVYRRVRDVVSIRQVGGCLPVAQYTYCQPQAPIAAIGVDKSELIQG